jgi:hypothetical protein
VLAVIQSLHSLQPATGISQACLVSRHHYDHRTNKLQSLSGGDQGKKSSGFQGAKTENDGVIVVEVDPGRLSPGLVQLRQDGERWGHCGGGGSWSYILS